MLKKEKNWYVVYTKPRWEKKIALVLQEKGIENYCPLNKVTKQWTDRKKVVLEPLFKGYIFICADENNKWDIKNIDGIINYIFWLGKPAVIRESEIITIKKFLNEFTDVKVTEQYAVATDEVQIKQGVMMNHKGIVLEIMGNKAKVLIKGMGIQLTAFFERKNLEKI
ncbi:MAG: UpxY family transcription antiterminator [Ferruginibacter sp.]|nr:UpxY family transcription antiterminator [Ferruginibacter sp.]